MGIFWMFNFNNSKVLGTSCPHTHKSLPLHPFHSFTTLALRAHPENVRGRLLYSLSQPHIICVSKIHFKTSGFIRFYFNLSRLLTIDIMQLKYAVKLLSANLKELNKKEENFILHTFAISSIIFIVFFCELHHWNCILYYTGVWNRAISISLLPFRYIFPSPFSNFGIFNLSTSLEIFPSSENSFSKIKFQLGIIHRSKKRARRIQTLPKFRVNPISLI